jgi:NAD(P)-dependent dehydrogenase (short-subunit alcohol dehydrogenase family)
MQDSKKIALVTGANKGIGLEVCRQLANLGFTVLLGSRDPVRGAESEQALQNEGLDVRNVEIDMNRPETFEQVARLISDEYGKLDVLVNNAGFAKDWAYSAADVPIEMLRETFDANFFGLVELTQVLLPLIRKSPAGRIVNQSSILGSLTLHSSPNSGLADIKPMAYNSSKTALNAFTVHLASALKDTPIKVNSAHPGSVKTDANPTGELSVEEGARTSVLLATLPPDGPTGGFFHMKQPLPW